MAYQHGMAWRNNQSSEAAEYAANISGKMAKNRVAWRHQRSYEKRHGENISIMAAKRRHRKRRGVTALWQRHQQWRKIMAAEENHRNGGMA